MHVYWFHIVNLNRRNMAKKPNDNNKVYNRTTPDNRGGDKVQRIRNTIKQEVFINDSVSSSDRPTTIMQRTATPPDSGGDKE